LSAGAPSEEPRAAAEPAGTADAREPATFDALGDIIAANFGVAKETLKSETTLEDLAIDSLAVIEVLFAVEDRFGIAIPSAPGGQGDFVTLGDLVAYVDRLVAEQHPEAPKD
jgi:acyl carrier protein